MTEKEISDWLVAYLARHLRISPNKVETGLPFDRYGLYSATCAGMIGDLGEWLKLELDPAIAYDYPSIDALAEYCMKTLSTEVAS